MPDVLDNELAHAERIGDVGQQLALKQRPAENGQRVENRFDGLAQLRSLRRISAAPHLHEGIAERVGDECRVDARPVAQRVDADDFVARRVNDMDAAVLVDTVRRDPSQDVADDRAMRIENDEATRPAVEREDRLPSYAFEQFGFAEAAGADCMDMFANGVAVYQNIRTRRRLAEHYRPRWPFPFRMRPACWKCLAGYVVRHIRSRQRRLYGCAPPPRRRHSHTCREAQPPAT